MHIIKAKCAYQLRNSGQAVQQLLPPRRAARYQLQVSVHVGRLSLVHAGPAAPSLANLNVKTANAAAYSPV